MKKPYETYSVRHWNNELNVVEIIQVTMKQIVFDCTELQLNLEDIGLVLLNERRKQYYLEPLTLNSTTGTYE